MFDGCVWGRGAFYDKGGVAMLLSAFMRAGVEKLIPPGDVVLAILSDEESGASSAPQPYTVFLCRFG